MEKFLLKFAKLWISTLVCAAIGLFIFLMVEAAIKNAWLVILFGIIIVTGWAAYYMDHHENKNKGE
jgi:uncharacterized membrane protein YecN with MAPEG domain